MGVSEVKGFLSIFILAIAAVLVSLVALQGNFNSQAVASHDFSSELVLQKFANADYLFQMVLLDAVSDAAYSAECKEGNFDTEAANNMKNYFTAANPLSKLNSNGIAVTLKGTLSISKDSNALPTTYNEIAFQEVAVASKSITKDDVIQKAGYIIVKTDPNTNAKTMSIYTELPDVSPAPQPVTSFQITC